MQGISGNATVGFTGSQGITGTTGFTGSRGFTGSQGITGITGFTGSQGITGITGFTGSQGIQGITGTGGVGFTGSQGTTGFTGFTGSQGIRGEIGFTGSRGFTGSQGVTGITGFTGSQGIQGITGTGGVGFTGSQGVQGIGGTVPGYLYNFSTTTGSGNPGAGYFNFNATTVGGITAMYIDSAGGATGFTVLAGVSTRGTLYVLNASNQAAPFTAEINGNIVENGGWLTVPLSNAYGTIPSNNEPRRLLSIPYGPQGIQGITGALSQWSNITANHNALPNERLIANTTAGSFTITMPEPLFLVPGDYVQITDGGNWAINNLLVNFNGGTIEGITDTLAINIPQATVELIYDGTTWHFTSTTGARGPIGFVADDTAMIYSIALGF